MPKSILILHCDIVKEPTIMQKNGFVFIEDGIVAATGSMADSLPNCDGTIIDGTDKLVIPGLINAHNHSPMTLFRGMADDLELNDWLNNHIFPAEAAHVSEEMVYWCSKLAAAEMLLSGTTCVADGYFLSDQSARAFAEVGIRAVVAHGIVDFAAPGVADPEKNIETVEVFINSWKEKSTLITPAVFAHSPYTCSPQTLQKAKKLADDNEVRFFIHLAESRDEQHAIISPAGNSPLRHLHNLGLLDSNCVLIHSIWLDDKDLSILGKSGAHVVLCPQSNYKLASGISRATNLARNGLRVGLGTDGCASNNGLDMFVEMDLMAKSQKVFHHDPTVFAADKVLEAATVNNNSILGFESPVSIYPGSRADLVLINQNAPHLTPFYNQDLLVYAIQGCDVDTVIVEGKLVVEKKQLTTFDLDETKKKVNELALPLEIEAWEKFYRRHIIDIQRIKF